MDTAYPGYPGDSIHAIVISPIMCFEPHRIRSVSIIIIDYNLLDRLNTFWGKFGDGEFLDSREFLSDASQPEVDVLHS